MAALHGFSNPLRDRAETREATSRGTCAGDRAVPAPWNAREPDPGSHARSAPERRGLPLVQGDPDRRVPARLGRLSAQMLLEVGEVSLGGAQFGLGVVEAGLFFADPFDDPRPGESGTRYAGSIGQRLER